MASWETGRMRSACCHHLGPFWRVEVVPPVREGQLPSSYRHWRLVRRGRKKTKQDTSAHTKVTQSCATVEDFSSYHVCYTLNSKRN